MAQLAVLNDSKQITLHLHIINNWFRMYRVSMVHNIWGIQKLIYNHNLNNRGHEAALLSKEFSIDSVRLYQYWSKVPSQSNTIEQKINRSNSICYNIKRLFLHDTTWVRLSFLVILLCVSIECDCKIQSPMISSNNDDCSQLPSTMLLICFA